MEEKKPVFSDEDLEIVELPEREAMGVVKIPGGIKLHVHHVLWFK